MANIEEKVESLIKETITNLGYELYDVIYEKEAQDYYLRIFIDTPEGISLNDCEKVSDSINDILDEADYIKDQYFLEVSSPGIERVLRKNEHLQANINKEIICNLFKPIIIECQKTEQAEAISDANDKKENTKEDAQNNSKKKKKVKTKKQKAEKQIEGILKSFDENKLVLQVELDGQTKPTEVEIERKNIAVAKLKYNWE